MSCRSLAGMERGTDDLGAALLELDAAGRAFVLTYLAGVARTNLEVRLALARALLREAQAVEVVGGQR
jgi:hypothetical protein